MEEFIEWIVKQLVDNKDQVVIRQNEDDNYINFTVLVAEEDMGKVIGRGGRIASAIRTLARTGNRKNNKRINIKFGDD
ncbi:MAG: KH domain-containing protein [Clostridia bacterium]